MARICLILSNPENRRLVAEYLKMLGHDVLSAEDSRTMQLPFDVGIVDGPALVMHEDEIARRKEAERPLVLPFILVTSRSEVGMATRFLWRTVDELLLTPLEKVELQARVENVLIVRRQSAEVGNFLLALSPALIMVMKLDGVVRLWSAAAESLFGKRKEPFHRLPMVGKDEEPLWRELLRRVSLGGSVHCAELPARKKDGTPCVLLVSAAPLRNFNGQVVEALILGVDITEKHLAEAAVREHLRHLEIIQRVSQNMRALERPEDVLPLLIDQLLTVLPYDSAVVYVPDEEGDMLLKTGGRGTLVDAFPTKTRLEDLPVVKSLMAGQGEYLDESFLRSFLRTDKSVRVLVAPVFEDRTVVAVLFLVSGLSAERKEPLISVTMSLCEIAGIAIHRLRLREETFRKMKQLETLRRIDLATVASFEKGIAADVLLRQACSHLGADAGRLWRFDGTLHQLHLLRHYGTGEAPGEVTIPLGKGLTGKVASERDVLLVNEETASAKELSWTDIGLYGRVAAYAGFPLIGKGELRGVLEFFFVKPQHFDHEWREFAETLAGQATLVLENFIFFEGLRAMNKRLQEAYEETLEGWAKTLELRNRETEDHCVRVASLAVRLAQALGVENDRLAHIRQGALLHDIGKIAIPDSILLKPASLSQEEWEVMRKHPIFAAQILEPIAYLRHSLAIPLYHHEKFDGTGYPHGLSGNAIPLEARIFAVVDVWDALTSERPYRKAWDRTDALGYIREQRGKYFDPEVVDAFLELVAEEEQSA